jgi:diguanylate cyclase (GGDEF)-like protein
VIISLLWNINATNLLIAVLFMITIPYLTIASRFAHDDYWTAIKTTKLLEQAAKEFSRLSNTDPLTQLYNRLYFEEKFQQEWRRCSRSGHSISIVLIDLENFKEVNHIHGRLTGDHCLLKVADILRARVHRAGDVVARFDGEVFSILLPNTGAQNAEMIANRLRKAITARPIVIEQQTIKLMASAGVATTTPQHSEGGQQLIKNADRALYRAKEKDYNQVETISY